jgi:carboxypeptidase Q
MRRTPSVLLSLLPRRPLELALLAVLCFVILGFVPRGQAANTAEALSIDKKLLDEAKNGSEILTNLTYLCDMIGPRLTGSPNLKKANEWTAEKMKAYGLENVHLEAWEIPMGWERGPATARIIEPDNGRVLSIASMGWSPGTNGKITSDVVIFKVEKAADLEQYKGKLKNAVVLRNAPAKIAPVTETNLFASMRPDRGNFGGGPRPNFEEIRAFQQQVRDFLKAEGVAAMLSDAGKPHNLLNMGGGWRGNDRASAAEPIPTLMVAHEHYAQLYRLASRPAPAKTRLELEVSNKFIPGPIAVYNTIGEIRGSDKPDEFVVVGAHIDSWDLGQGATDNGTGTSVVLETARILVKSGIKPRRTIRFCLFSGEEQGLYGSKAYVAKHKDEMAKTSMALVHDTGTGKVTGIGLTGREILKPIFEEEMASLKEIGVKEINTRNIPGSDHMSFEREGVPGFMFHQDFAEYRFTHHSQSDTVDKAHEADLIQGAQAMAVTAVRVANLPNLLPRDKPAGAGSGRRGGETTPPKADEKKPDDKKPVEKQPDSTKKPDEKKPEMP